MYLYARCEDVAGNWHPAQLDMNRCPGGPVANNNSVLVCGPGGYGISNDLPRGSWRSSCRDASKSGGTLYAQCDNGYGSWHSTSLDLDDCPGRIIGNANGNLVCSSGSTGDRDDFNQKLPGGNWHASCRDGYMRGSWLYAKCNTGEGVAWHQSSLNVNSCANRLVTNIGGDLACQHGPVGGRAAGDGAAGGGYSANLPPGSWRTTCRNGRMVGPIVYAECYDGAGNWRQASFDTRRCNGPLGNSHGVLVCSKGSGGAYRRTR